MVRGFIVVFVSELFIASSGDDVAGLEALVGVVTWGVP